MVFYVGWTLIQIPVSAWAGSELRGRYHERSRVQTFFHADHGGRAAAGRLSLPTRPGLQIGYRRAGVQADQDLKVAADGEASSWSAFLPTPSCDCCCWCRKEAACPPRRRPRPSTAEAPTSLVAARDPAAAQGADLLDFAVTLGQLIRSSLFVFFVSAYMGRPDLTAALFLLQFVFGIFAGLDLDADRLPPRASTAPPSPARSPRSVINLALLLVTPEALPLLIGLTVAQGLAQGSGNLMLRAMVCDVADKQRLETGVDRTGLLFSIFA